MYCSRLLKNSTPRIAGLSGLVILLWGITPWLRSLDPAVPPLELAGLALAGAAMSSCLLPVARGAFLNAPREYPWYTWAITAGGFIGSSAFFYTALTYAPAAQAVVIAYIWPLLFAIASDVYGHRRPAPVTIVALLVGLAVVAIMHGITQAPSLDAWLGYAAALASGLCWVVYSLFVQGYSRSITSAYPAFFALAAVVALGLQAATGDFVWPHSPVAWVASFALGVGPYGLGFIAWGYVVRHGNPHIVPVLPYAVPAVAAITLVLAGQTPSTLSLWAGCALVVVACMVSTRVRAAH
jgi:drug/metabolite transporter (DMT)-like permease